MRFAELKEAIRSIKDGSLVTYSGMQLSRPPMAAIFEIIRQGKKNLKLVSIPNAIVADILIAAGCVSSVKTGFNGFFYENGFVISPNWRKAVENKDIELYETDIFEILQGFRAAGLGIDEIEAVGMKNTDYLKIREYKKTEKGVIVNAIRPDVAIIHAQYADKKGNVLISDNLIEESLVKASKVVIVTVEKIKEFINPTIPAEDIDYVCVVPNGASPAACFGFYNYSIEHLKKYIDYAKSGRMDDYIMDYIHSAKDHNDFLRMMNNNE